MKNLPYYGHYGNYKGQRFPKYNPRKIMCPVCFKEEMSRNPHKIYCSERCSKIASNKRRKSK